MIPTAAILVDEMLQTALRVVPSIAVNRDRITANLETTGGQIYAEFVMDALIKRGVPRFEAYRDVQRVAFQAMDGGVHFRDAVKADPAISSNLDDGAIDGIFAAESHLGASKAIIDGVSELVRSESESLT